MSIDSAIEKAAEAAWRVAAPDQEFDLATWDEIGRAALVAGLAELMEPTREMCEEGSAHHFYDDKSACGRIYTAMLTALLEEMKKDR